MKISDEKIRHLFIKKYRTQIFRIRDIFSGKSNRVIRDMQKDMEQCAQNEQFEEAMIIKQQVISLISLQSQKIDPMIYTQTTTQAGNMYEDELTALLSTLHTHFPSLDRLNRIECVDISNISGLLATGSLVVLSLGLADSSQYRKFRIRLNHTSGKPNDPAMISEVVTRRLAHTEWPYPDLLVIDGGKSSVSAAQSMLQKNNLNLPVVGLAKRMEEIVIKQPNGKYITLRLSLHDPALHVLQRIRDEAHRFAKSYHIHLRNKFIKGKYV